MRHICRFALLLGILALAISGVSRPALALVYCEQIKGTPCITLGATGRCEWMEEAGAIGICTCRQAGSGKQWECV